MAYGTDAGFAEWLETMGYTLPPTAPTPAILRARGSAYIDGTYEAHWTGTRTDGVMQPDGWPRTGALFNCTTAIPSDIVPPAVINAAYLAAYLEAVTPGILKGQNNAGARIRRQKVDVIEREFFEDKKPDVGSGGGAFVDATIDGAMRAFICDDTGAAFMWALN